MDGLSLILTAMILGLSAVICVGIVCYTIMLVVEGTAVDSAETISEEALEKAYAEQQKDPEYADFQNVINELMEDFK